MRDSTGHEVDYNPGEPPGYDDDVEGGEEPGTAIIRIDPASDAGALALYNEAVGLQQYADRRAIQSVEDIGAATDDLGLISKLKRAIEAKRKEYVDPINAHLKAVNEAFKALLAPVEQADAITRRKILDYKREEQRKADEAAEINRLRLEASRREAALNDGELSQPTQLVEIPAAPPAKVHAQTADLGTAKVWKWELIDIARVPAEYLMVDTVKVGKVVRAGVRDIPGVRIYSEDTLRVTSR